MPEVHNIYKGIKDSIFMMPIRCLMFYTNDGTTLTWTHIFRLESESNYHIKPITRPSSKGGKVTLGYSFEGRLYVSHNEYSGNGLIELLQGLANRRDIPADTLDVTGRAQAVLYLGNETPIYYPSAQLPIPKIENSTNGQWLELSHQCTVSFEIESVELRPRMIIELNGVFRSLYKASNDKMFH